MFHTYTKHVCVCWISCRRRFVPPLLPSSSVQTRSSIDSSWGVSFSLSKSLFVFPLTGSYPTYWSLLSLSLSYSRSPFLPPQFSETLWYISREYSKLQYFCSYPPCSDLNKYFHLIPVFTVKQTCLYKYVFSSSSRGSAHTRTFNANVCSQDLVSTLFNMFI